jgi:hypothetical protein
MKQLLAIPSRFFFTCSFLKFISPNHTSGGQKVGEDQHYEQLLAKELRSKWHQIINLIELIHHPDNSMGIRSGMPP